MCPPSCLLISNGSDITAINAEDFTSRSVVSGQSSRADVLDIHFDKGLIFWCDVDQLTISRARIDGSGVTVLLTGVGPCGDLAVDWISNSLYWVDAGPQHRTIAVSGLDGSNARYFFWISNEKPRGLALDPTRE